MGVTVTRDLVANLTAGNRVVYADGLLADSTLWQTMATTMPSTQNTEVYTWMSETPRMREFVDERAIKSYGEYSYAIKNRKFEVTIGIEREALEDEQYGQIKTRIRNLAGAVGAHYEQLVFSLLALNGVCYDGLAFFHASHKVGAATVSNLGTAAFSADALEDTLTSMSQVPLDNGEPMMVRPTHLLVPPALRFAAKRVLNSVYYPEATGTGQPGALSANPLHGELELIVSPRLTTSTEWYVLDCSKPVKPFLVQQRIEPELTALDGTDGESEMSFLRDVYLYGVRSRDNAGYGLWQYAYKSTGAGS